MLVGRAGECEQLDEQLAGAREAAGAIRVLRGPPGVGKTSLLDWVLARAVDLQAVAVECRQDDEQMAFSGLRTIVEPLAAHLDELLPDQAAALRGMLGSAAATAPDVVALGAALLALVSQVAEREPLLVVIDDAHWIDPSSAQALTFALRRIDREPIAVLLSVRDTEKDLFSQHFPVTTLAGLSPLDAAELLAGKVSTRVAEELADRTLGNPLALLEITEQLSDAERAGERDLPSVVALGEVLAAGFARRTKALSEQQRFVLLLAAAEPHPNAELLEQAAAMTGIAPSIVVSVLDIGILDATEGGGVRFTHPLLRQAIYEQAPAEARREAHRRLGSVMDDVGRGAWHLAAAAEGPDEDAAEALSRTGEQARESGDSRAAAAAFTRAAELSIGGARRERLVAAGRALAWAGDVREAVVLFEQALDESDDPIEQADITLEQLMSRVLVDGPSGVDAALSGLAEQLEPVDRERAALMYALAPLAAAAQAKIRLAEELCDRSIALGPAPESPAAGLTNIYRPILQAIQGRTEESVPTLVMLAELLSAIPLTPDMTGPVDFLANALAWCGQFSASSSLISHYIADARAQSALAMLGFGLTVRSELYFRTGHWEASLADGAEAVERGNDTAQVGLSMYALIALARVEAGLGNHLDARAHINTVLERATSMQLDSMVFWASGVAGFLSLSEGRLDAAVTELENARELAARGPVRLLMSVPWAPDLLEVYLRQQRTDDAQALVHRLEADNVETQGHLATAVLRRCQGLVAEEYEKPFVDALAEHATVPAPFERARTELCFGERLRRDRRYREAGEQLAAAAATFARLGATSWLHRADAELQARSGPTGPNRPNTREELSPQEFRTAVVVGSGVTNREAAAALFLSPRTVEFHLQSIYRKLGIRSRSALVRLVAEDPRFAVEVPDASTA